RTLYLLMHRRPPRAPLFPYTTLFRSHRDRQDVRRDRELPLEVTPHRRREVRVRALGADDGRLQDGVRDGGAEEYRAVQRRRQGREMILAYPAGDEWGEREPEQQVQVRPHHLAVDPLGGVKHVVMVVPVDA